MSSVIERNEPQSASSLVRNLRSQSKSEIYSSLAVLKKDQKCHKQFIKDGGIVPLIALLRSENVKILDLALSVLANMCLHAYVRQEVNRQFQSFHLLHRRFFLSLFLETLFLGP